ncbi:SDR family NAD(P)-dependent oxidoreductase [Paroceanicella profunda]|uniref:SDR family NAD(P)-dependent oxidoreductase n=1 Tax=Paroceanicella profunda TaxID=2579971 RepID=A0A5B8FXC7_9RHOB|nr:SDR family oxidoreductase [Paroceanicella profunda]QDL93155.1 SDR family NAD(P)-dependent oxidoreductase [Paroceanicella profunda]
MSRWTTKDLPSLQGRSVVITGTGGIGYETAVAMAGAGATVLLSGRNPTSGRAAVDRIRAATPGANVSFEQIDLADLNSIAAFGERLRAGRDSLDLLINNAGVMAPPDKRLTKDGFELQFGTNFLGHFALTAHLLPLLRLGHEPRVVTLGSIAANGGAIDFSNLNAERSYKPMVNYSQSKLACVLFALELQRRSQANAWGVDSIGAHPGVSRSDLITNSANRWHFSSLMRTYLPFLFQPVAQGALPTLYAATSPDARPGGYYGPNRMGETRGYPVAAKIVEQAADPQIAARLWEEAIRLTGVSFGQSVESSMSS